MAQQIVNHKKSDRPTFRAWDPNDEHAEVGREKRTTESECPTWCIITCMCCYCVEKCFKSVFKEEINVLQHDDASSEEIFDKMAKGNKGTTTCIRWCAWFLNIFGHYLLFTPIIKLIAWIPLLGALLSNIIAFACLIFSIVWASMLHCIVLAVAWIVYRPMYGALMLLAVFIGIIAMSYGDGGTYDIT